MVAVRLVFPLFFALLGFFLVTFPAEGQFTPQQVGELVVNPLYPAPHSEFTITLEAYTLNTTGATIVWSVDGVPQTERKNERSITLKTGNIGDSQKVSVTVTPPNGPSLTYSHTVTPSQVDLILEANTYTPAFYKGRALPSGNSIARAIAIVHTVPYTPPESLTYEWKQGGKVLFGGPVKGKYAADVTVSRFDGDIISVVATNAAGKSVGGKSMTLNPVEPELHFYEENPLRGLSDKALNTSFSLIGEEATIHAEPFFMATNLFPHEVTFSWSVDGRAVTPNSDAHTLTLRKMGEGGNARIEVTAVTTTAIPQYTRNAFSIIF